MCFIKQVDTIIIELLENIIKPRPFIFFWMYSGVESIHMSEFSILPLYFQPHSEGKKKVVLIPFQNIFIKIFFSNKGCKFRLCMSHNNFPFPECRKIFFYIFTRIVIAVFQLCISVMWYLVIVNAKITQFPLNFFSRHWFIQMLLFING